MYVRIYVTRDYARPLSLKFNLRETCNACSLIIHESRVLTVVTVMHYETASFSRSTIDRHTDRTIHLRMRKLIE